MRTKGAIRKDVPKGTESPKAKAPAGGKRGRPPEIRTKANADRICALLAEGMSLRKICEMDGMPSKPAILDWLAIDADFAAQYAQARVKQAEGMGEELLEIADDGRNDWMEKLGKDGQSLGWMVNGEAVQRSRLRVDTRKWLLSKMLPKKYGEKIEHEHSGPNGAPIPVAVSAVDYAALKADLAALPKRAPTG